MYKCYKKDANGAFILTTLTPEIKNAFKHNISSAFLQIAASGEQQGFLINDDNYLQSLIFDDCRYSEVEGILGTCIAKQLEGKFVNVDSNFDIENRELQCYVGTQVIKYATTYILTEDKKVVANKTYYIINENSEFVPVENPIEAALSTYFEKIIVNDIEEYYLNLGTFIVQKPENDNVRDNTSFIALDYMIKFNKEYTYRMGKYILTSDTEINTAKKYFVFSEAGVYVQVANPIQEDISTYYEYNEEYTLLQLLQDICNQVGVTLGQTHFRNSNYVITGNRFDSGVTCRDVLKAIAQMAFSWARIDEDNNLLLDFEVKNEISEEITYDEFYSLSFNDEYGPVNTIILKDENAEGENITIQDETEDNIKELVIAGNPFAYDEANRKGLIEAGREIFGFRYVPLLVNTIGVPYLNCKEKIRVQNMQDEYFETYVFNTRIEYAGTLKSSVESPAMTKTETLYKYDGKLTTAQRRTEFRVNKAEQKINSLILSSDEQGKKLSNIEQDVSGVKTTIEDTTGKFNDRLTLIENSINGISTKLTTTGGQNLIRNSVGYFGNEYWDLENSEEKSLIKGNSSTEVKQNSVSGSALEIQNETVNQTINEIKNGYYVVSFSYKKIVSSAVATFKINDININLTEQNWKEETKTIAITQNQIKISITSDVPSSVLITDLILSEGTTKAGWSQNANESYTDNVQIGKGVRITATGSDTEFVAEASGITINNTESGNKVAEFTKYGTETQELVAHKDVKIADSLLIQKIGNQTWFSSL